MIIHEWEYILTGVSLLHIHVFTMIYTMVSEHRIEHRREKTTTLKAIILKILLQK